MSDLQPNTAIQINYLASKLVHKLEPKGYNCLTFTIALTVPMQHTAGQIV